MILHENNTINCCFAEGGIVLYIPSGSRNKQQGIDTVLRCEECGDSVFESRLRLQSASRIQILAVLQSASDGALGGGISRNAEGGSEERQLHDFVVYE